MFKDINAACRDDLAKIIKAFAAATELSLATVSRKFHGNQAFFKNFIAGKCTITLDKLSTILVAIADDWPLGAAWPAVSVLRRPPKKGVVYVIRWANRPKHYRIGFTKSFTRRMAQMQAEAVKAGTTVDIVGSLPGFLWNERAAHRHLLQDARRPGERSWYSGPAVEVFIAKILSEGFDWNLCPELAEADSKHYPNGQRKKSANKNVDGNPR